MLHLVTILVQKGLIHLAEGKKSAPLEYRGRPLRRKDNLIYYGSMSDKYIIMLQILDTKKVKDMGRGHQGRRPAPAHGSGPEKPDRVVKKSEKDSLYAAMDVATVWLDRALANR